MDPVYRNMNSYPHQRDQIHYSPHFYPGTEPIPTQMYTNPGRPPLNYGSWPWGSNYGYTSPIACHGCCNRNHPYFANHYTIASPYSQHVPLPHCPVSYPLYPVQYVPPPPCYPTEHPWYEYEKNVPMGGQHCCGCPNHKSHQKEQRNVRIEEEELPDGERKRNDFLIPLRFKNGTYPIVWMPSDYGNKKEHGNDDNNNSGVWRDGTKNGWYPLDLNNLVSSNKQTGDEERKHQHDDDDGKGSFPCQLFWMPYKPEGKENEMETYNKNDSNAKPILEPEKGSRVKKKFHMIGEDMGGQDASRLKDIPVREHEENETSENQEKERDVYVKDGIDHGEKKVDNGESKSSKESVKRKSPSPPKSTKLRPVCLRVDPLPRKKTTNGSSRSPSPPDDKQKPDLRSDKAKNKVLNSSGDKKRDKIIIDEFKEGKGTKIIKVVDGKTWQEKNMDVNMETRVNRPEEKPKEGNDCRECFGTVVPKGQTKEAESAMWKNEEVFRAKEGRADEAKETSKRKLSEEEAAVIIQSAYRGFDVRRWEPIKKLKQIAKVQEQIDYVKHMIQATESSSDIQDSSKQRNIVSETIMSLLLKLDTIQGSHPIIREIRKSVVKELVNLQEKLDSIMNEKSKNLSEKESSSRNQDDALHEIEDVKLSKNGNETPSDLPKADQNQHNGPFNSEKEDNLNAEEFMEKLENEDEKSNEGLENNEISTANDDNEDLVLEQSSILLDSLEKVTDFATFEHEELDSELAELPQGVLDDLYAQVDTDQKPVDPDSKKASDKENNEIESENNETDFLTEREMSIQLLREGDSEQDMIGVENTAENESEKNDRTDYVENLGAFKDENGDKMDVVCDKGEDDVLTKRNRELIEENERLRGIMEDLIKSGQDQLTAISSLTGRVKDLEMKLSKKKKLKVKTRKSNKMRTLVPDDE